MAPTMRVALHRIVLLTVMLAAARSAPAFAATPAEDTAAAFRADGLGAVVNSSRGILFPYLPEEKNWEHKICEAAELAIRQITGAQKRE